MLKPFLLSAALTAITGYAHLPPLTISTTSLADQNLRTPDADGCDVPNVRAETIFSATPEVPLAAEMMGLSGTTYVQVDLGADGRLLNASVAKTSGSRLLDREALMVARQSTFRAEVRNCQPVAGAYLFIVEFAA